MNEIYEQIEERINNSSKKTIYSSIILGFLMICIIIYLAFSSIEHKIVPIVFTSILLFFLFLIYVLQKYLTRKQFLEYTTGVRINSLRNKEKHKDYITVSIPDTETVYNISIKNECNLKENSSSCYLVYQSFLELIQKAKNISIEWKNLLIFFYFYTKILLFLKLGSGVLIIFLIKIIQIILHHTVIHYHCLIPFLLVLLNLYLLFYFLYYY